jgi:hypothetical protein
MSREWVGSEACSQNAQGDRRPRGRSVNFCGV